MSYGPLDTHAVQNTIHNPIHAKLRQLKKHLIKAQYGVFKLIAHIKPRWWKTLSGAGGGMARTGYSTFSKQTNKQKTTEEKKAILELKTTEII